MRNTVVPTEPGRFANTGFGPDFKVLEIGYSERVAVVEPEIPAETERWNASVNIWNNNIQNLYSFATQNTFVKT